MTMNELIMKAREKKCSDIHISEGMPVSFRIHGQLLDSGFSFPAAETREMILSMLSDEQREQLENGDDVDFAIETPDYCRQRVNVFRQMKKVAATIRLLNNTIPTPDTWSCPLCIPPVRRRRWIVSLTAVRPTPRTRSGHSCPRF